MSQVEIPGGIKPIDYSRSVGNMAYTEYMGKFPRVTENGLMTEDHITAQMLVAAGGGDPYAVNENTIIGNDRNTITVNWPTALSPMEQQEVEGRFPQGVASFQEGRLVIDAEAFLGSGQSSQIMDQAISKIDNPFGPMQDNTRAAAPEYSPPNPAEKAVAAPLDTVVPSALPVPEVSPEPTVVTTPAVSAQEEEVRRQMVEPEAPPAPEEAVVTAPTVSAPEGYVGQPVVPEVPVEHERSQEPVNYAAKVAADYPEIQTSHDYIHTIKGSDGAPIAVTDEMAREVQVMLVSKGYDIEVDGKIGQKTLAALEEWKTTQPIVIEETGMGQETVAAVYTEIKVTAEHTPEALIPHAGKLDNPELPAASASRDTNYLDDLHDCVLHMKEMQGITGGVDVSAYEMSNLSANVGAASQQQSGVRER